MKQFGVKFKCHGLYLRKRLQHCVHLELLKQTQEAGPPHADE